MRKGLPLSYRPKHLDASIFGTLVSSGGRVYITAIAVEPLVKRYILLPFSVLVSSRKDDDPSAFTVEVLLWLGLCPSIQHAGKCEDISKIFPLSCSILAAIGL